MVHVDMNNNEVKGRCGVVGLSAVLIALLWSGVCPAQIWNPSFEEIYESMPWPRFMPSGWKSVENLSFYSYSTDIWSTDGDLSACLHSLEGKSFFKGQCQSLRQNVNLTDMSFIAFDVVLGGNPDSRFMALFLVDGVPLWSETVEGEYLNQQVDVSGLAYYHRIELRIMAIEDGFSSESCWTLWDNVRFVDGSTTIEAVIDLDSDTLNLGSRGKWVTCYIELPEGYDVAEIDGATVTLEDIAAYISNGRWGGGWARAEAREGNLVDHDGDGVPERMVRFERAAVQEIVQPPETTITVSGRLVDGTLFEGMTTIRVIDNQCNKK